MYKCYVKHTALMIATMITLQAISCTNVGKRTLSHLPDKGDFISYRIEFYRLPLIDETYIKLIVENVAPFRIRVPVPICPFAQTYPYCADSNGVLQPFHYFVQPNCGGELKALAPGEKTDVDFGFTLEESFGLTKPGLYEVWFEYYGNVYNLDREIIANDTSHVLSNRIRFTVP